VFRERTRMCEHSPVQILTSKSVHKVGFHKQILLSSETSGCTSNSDADGPTMSTQTTVVHETLLRDGETLFVTRKSNLDDPAMLIPTTRSRRPRRPYDGDPSDGNTMNLHTATKKISTQMTPWQGGYPIRHPANNPQQRPQ
jgi:hypothetical protein